MLRSRARVSGSGLGIPSPSVQATLQPGTELDTEWVTRRRAARSQPGLELGGRWWGLEWEGTRPEAGHSPALGDIQNDLKVSDLRSGPGPSLHGARRVPRTGWLEAPPPDLEVCPSHQGPVRAGQGGAGGGTEHAHAWPSLAGCHVAGGGGRGRTGRTHAPCGPRAPRPPGTDVSPLTQT